MKTSKKLLSLFLSLVMIITSCSVGFTAFAADGNNTDSNNNYWKDDTTAAAAFESVDALLNMLVQGVLKDTLEDKNIVNPVTSETTLSDVVQGASPMIIQLVAETLANIDLLSILSGLLPEGTTLPDFGLTKTEFLLREDRIGDKYNKNRDYYNKWYEPLDKKDDDLLSFYALYGICEEHKDDGGELGAYCTETLEKLDALYASITEPVLKPESLTDEDLSNKFLDAVVSETGLDTTAAVLNDYKTATYQGKALADYTVDDIKATDAAYHLDYYNNVLAKLGKPEIADLAELLYYARSSFEKYNLVYDLYFKLVSEAGGSIDTSALGVSSGTADEVAAAYLDSENAAAAAAGEPSAFKYEFNKSSFIICLSLWKGDAHDESAFNEYFKAFTFNQLLYEPQGDDMSSLSATGDVVNGYFRELTKALATEAGLETDGLEITDSQLLSLITAATDGKWGSKKQPMNFFNRYLDGDDNVLSGPATDYLKALAAKNEDAIIDFIKQLDGGNVLALRAYSFTDSEQSYFDRGGYSGCIDRINAMVYSQELINELMWESKAKTMANQNVTSAVNVYEFFCEYIANEQGEEPEIDTDPYEPYTGKIYHYSDYAIPDSLIVKVADYSLNKVLVLLKMELIEQFLDSYIDTSIDLYDKLYGIWQKLYDAPTETVFELLPTLVILVDELVLPLLIRDESAGTDFIFGVLAGILLGDHFAVNGSGAEGNPTDSKIGIKNFAFDLNKVLPSVLHWVTGDCDGAVAILDNTFWTDIEGTDADGEDTIFHYNHHVPMFTGIYIADKVVAASTTPAELMKNIAGLIGGSTAETLQKDWLVELVGSVLVNLRTAVDDYLDLHSDVKRYAIAVDDVTGEPTTYVLQSGLNYLSVSLPYLIDQLGKNFNTRNNVDSDWAFVYDGKIQMKNVTISLGDKKDKVNEFINVHFQRFKNFALKGSGATPADIIAQFIDLLIGNWVNGLLDFLNDNIMDNNADNLFIGRLPLAQGLLEALGGFSDTSIISDALNGLFQLKRCDDASFTLTERETTKFVGLSNESALFLINNIMFVKNGEVRGLIPFIQGLTAEEKTASSTTETSTTETASSEPSPLLTLSVKKSKASTTDYDRLLTDENKAAAQVLIDILDELLSSLLENTSLNGFDLDSTENLLSGAVTLFAAYFGAQNTNDLLKLLNNYLFYVVGEQVHYPSSRGDIGNDPTSDGNVDVKKVYTSANLSNLVIQTYSFLENIVDYFFYKNNGKGILGVKDPNELVADALYGIVSPDAVAMRLTKDYADTAKILKKKDYHNWNSFKVEITALDDAGYEYNTHDFLKYGFSKGDKDAFYKALGESFNGVAALLGALFATSYTNAKRSGNLYSTVLHPLLSTLAESVGAKAPMSVADYNKAYAEKNYGKTLVDGIILPIGNILAPLYDKPFTFIVNLLFRGLSGVLRDSSLQGILNGVIDTVNVHLKGLYNFIYGYTPSGADSIDGLIYGALDGIFIRVKYLDDNGNAAKTDDITLKTLLKRGAGILPPNVGSQVYGLIVDLILNALGISEALPEISLDRIYASKSTAETFLLVYGYLVDSLLGIDLITTLIKSLDPEIAAILNNISAAQLLDVIVQVIKSLKSPTEAFWSFSEYKGKIKSHFKYPNKLTAAEADEDVYKLDNIVENVFPLLNSFGVTDIEGLPQLINDNLYTNDIITKLAKALYGALSGNSTVVSVLNVLSLDVSPAGLANYLTDKSYGKTYSSAAKALRKAKSWDDVGSINWGFKDKTANAQTGFINGLAAALRPLNNILSLLLCEGNLDQTKIDTKKIVAMFDGQGGSTEILTDSGPESKVFDGKHENAATLEYKLKGTKLYLTVQSYNVTGSGNRAIKSELIIDLAGIADDLNKLIGTHIDLNFGTNGYENAIIPLLEAFMCKNVKTYKQYKKDYKKAKDNLLIDILKPIGGLIDDVAAAPFDTLTAILPNVAYFIDSNGVSQAVGNLLAPLLSDDGVLGVLKKNGFDLEKLITSITGKSLGKILADFIGYNGKLTLHLNDLKSFNIQDIVYPLVNKLLKENYGIKLPKFTFAQIASHGTIHKVRSAARNTKGKFETRQVEARQGEVLFAVLTYVARTLIDNAKALKDLLGGIDAIKNNDTIKKILDSIFDNIAVAQPEDITGIVVYLLNGNATDKFFDYRNFKYKGSSFSWGELDEDFCRQLAPMLDGLIKGLINDGEGLTALVSEKLYTDDLVAKAATGIYGAIEGVNVGDGSLTSLLAQTGIDFSTDNVADLLTDSSYGRSYPGAASVIRKAGSWSNVKAESLKFGVNGRDSFIHALTAVLRPMFGVLDVLLNDASLNVFNMVDLPGSDGYTSTIVPLLEALGVYNIKTQYEYRKDIYNEYDCILLDILNPLWDKVEDVLEAPLETVADILPNLALFFANGGVAQILDNLLTPITALLDVLRPVADINEILKAAGLDVPKLLKDKVGITLPKFDLYDLQGTLNGVIGPDKIVPLINSILPKINIAGASLNLELPDIDWLELASCGELITDQPSQAACYGRRMYVKSDQDITLITVLRYLIETINYKDNYQRIVDLVGGIDGMSDTVAQVVGEVLGMLQGDTDAVIKDLIDLLQSLAG